MWIPLEGEYFCIKSERNRGLILSLFSTRHQILMASRILSQNGSVLPNSVDNYPHSVIFCYYILTYFKNIGQSNLSHNRKNFSLEFETIPYTMNLYDSISMHRTFICIWHIDILTY